MSDVSQLGPAIRWQTAAVSKIVVRTPRITSFFFSLPQPFAFQAGQHVDVRLTAPDGYRAMRSYSIASAPDSGALELAIEKLDAGEVSSFFHDVVVVGDSIELRGPLGGYFLWPARDPAPVLLAGGGSGIVPLMSMLRHRRVVGDTRPVVLVYSVRTMRDAVFADELLELERLRDGFALIFAVTRDAPARAKDFGRRIDGAMMDAAVARLPVRPGAVFVCGSNAFVNAAADGVVAAGVDARVVRTERYGG